MDLPFGSLTPTKVLLNNQGMSWAGAWQPVPVFPNEQPDPASSPVRLCSQRLCSSSLQEIAGRYLLLFKGQEKQSGRTAQGFERAQLNWDWQTPPKQSWSISGEPDHPMLRTKDSHLVLRMFLSKNEDEPSFKIRKIHVT